jgi:hypothetical protein
MFEYDVKFIFDGFLVITSVYAETDRQAKINGIDKLYENGLAIDDLGHTYQIDLKVTGAIA